MKKSTCISCIVVLLLLTVAQASAQFPQWTDLKLFAGTTYEEGHDIYIDKKGNVYIAGEFEDAIKNPPGVIGLPPENFEVECQVLTPPREANELVPVINAFVLRYDSLRHLTLTLTLPGRPAEVKTDDAGNIYVVGLVEDTYSFDGVVTVPGSGVPDGFIAKYTPEGKLIWYRIAGSDQVDVLSSLDIDAKGNIAVSGFTNGDDVYMFGERLAGPFSFTASFSPGGEINWIQTEEMKRAERIRYDSAGNLVMAGSVNDNGNIRIWMAKAEGATGRLLWQDTAGSDPERTDYIQSAYGVAVAPDGSYYFGGNYLGNAVFGTQTVQAVTSDNNNIFLLQTDTAGHIRWVTTGGGTGFNRLYNINTSRSGDLLFTATYSNGFRLAGTALSSNGYTGVCAGALDKQGGLKWMLAGGSHVQAHEGEFAYFDRPGAIAEDSKGQVHVTGTTTGSGAFGGLQYQVAEAYRENVFWSIIGNTAQRYNITYPCNNGESTGGAVWVYPNPFSHWITVQLSGSFITPGTTTLQVYDMGGRKLFTGKWTGSTYTTFALQNLPAGIYIGIVENSGGRKMIKMVKGY